MSIVAIIGHGRSPEDKAWGTMINGCDVVVRMWDWTWQQYNDYGDKYDYGLFTISPADIPVFWQRKGRPPAFGWLGYNLVPFSCKLPMRTTKIDQARWIEFARRLGGASTTETLHLTRGTVAACWAIENLDASSIVLVGFDNVYAGVHLPWQDAFSPEYSEVYFGHKSINRSKKYPADQRQSVTHDMAIERPLLLNRAKLFGVELQFAQDVW